MTVRSRASKIKLEEVSGVAELNTVATQHKNFSSIIYKSTELYITYIHFSTQVSLSFTLFAPINNFGQKSVFTVHIDSSSFEKVLEFKYLGTTLTNQNSIQEEIKSRLKLRNACY
jgi:hypothetical protein